MVNGTDLINELKYKEQVKNLGTEAKLDYLIDKTYDHHVALATLKEECSPLSKRQQVGISGVTSFLISVAIGIASYFKGN